MKLIMIAFAMTLIGCGKGEVAGEKTIRVIEETITCGYATPNTCSNNRMVCRRENFRAEEWHCTLVLEVEE